MYFLQTPIDKQELLCGQLAGVGRCVSELSSSPVRILRLRRSKFAVRMRDDFFWVSEPEWVNHHRLYKLFLTLFHPECASSLLWVVSFLFFSLQALGCSMDVPTVSVCELLDQLISLFCFYNGSVRQSYQVQASFVKAVL